MEPSRFANHYHTTGIYHLVFVFNLNESMFGSVSSPYFFTSSFNLQLCPILSFVGLVEYILGVSWPQHLRVPVA